MKRFLITFYVEHCDEAVDHEEIVEALNKESALKIFLHNNQNRLIKRGKNSIQVKQIN